MTEREGGPPEETSERRKEGRERGEPMFRSPSAPRERPVMPMRSQRGLVEPGSAVRSRTHQAQRDEAYYDEVRRAVGSGTPTLLLGTSTKSLQRSLAKLTAVQQGKLPSAPRAPSEAAAPPDDEVEITSVRVRPRWWLWALSILFLGILGVAGTLPHEPWARALLVIGVPLAFLALSIVVSSRPRPMRQHYVSTSLLRLYVHQSDIVVTETTKGKASAEHQSK